MARAPADIELSDQLNQLEQQLTLLQREYDQFFLALTKVPPSTRRSQVQQTINRLTSREIVNTVLRFRAQQLIARFVSLRSYWDRVMADKEAGRDPRDRLRAQLRQAAAGDGAPHEAAPAAPQAPPPHPLQGLFESFVATRQRLGEPIDNLSVERLADFVERQRAALEARYGKKEIEFRVVEEEGKTKLKAVLKKSG